MQNQLKIALIQSDLVWENPQQNRLNFSKNIESINNEVDLVVLPEMFSSGFTMNAERVAESMNGETIVWMQNMAKKMNAAIAGSIVISENNNYYNRFLFVYPNGTLQFYNKRHTFTLAGEDKFYTAGNEKVVIDYKGWKICPLVCYDLRFPVWARNAEDYDVLLYVANWPKPRIFAWDTLLKARAIENMCYCIGVNRVGVDGYNSEYTGHSACYDVFGNEMTNFKPSEEGIEVVTLEKDHIKTYRGKLKFLEDRDSFTIT